MKTLPTVHTYPGLELGGLDGGLGLDTLKQQVETYLKAKLDQDVLPRVRSEAMKGAKDAVTPMILGVGALSVTALILSIVALLRTSRR